ncbi:hypothetical protein QR685DRAFT_90297 [Neurospora intermedia]|uniref:Uncharacterized protein n=1 Tax=Neurospora intermedia TaxID=5142 RepID=A0ABR3D3H0_NEUIN
MMTFMTLSFLALLFMLSSQSQFFDWRMNTRTSHKGAAGQPLRKIPHTQRHRTERRLARGNGLENKSPLEGRATTKRIGAGTFFRKLWSPFFYRTI